MLMLRERKNLPKRNLFQEGFQIIKLEKIRSFGECLGIFLLEALGNSLTTAYSFEMYWKLPPFQGSPFPCHSVERHSFPYN